MKKVKVMLTALTVLAVVGGALAFKAKSENRLYICDTSVDKCKLDPVHFYDFDPASIVPSATTNSAAQDKPCDESCPDPLPSIAEQ